MPILAVINWRGRFARPDRTHAGPTWSFANL